MDNFTAAGSPGSAVQPARPSAVLERDRERGSDGSSRAFRPTPLTSSPLSLVLLDDLHLADALFVQTLGRFVAGHDGPLAFVHGDGGLTGRALEARGILPGDPLPDGVDAARVAAHRAQTQTLVRRLNDAGVPAVGFQGHERGLLSVDDAGTVIAPRAAWLAGEAGRGAVPVVAATARPASGEAVAVSGGEALAALAGALAPDAEAVLLALLDRPEVPTDARAEAALKAAGVVARVGTVPALFAPRVVLELPGRPIDGDGCSR